MSVIRFTHEDWETFGACSLEGRIPPGEKEIVLEIEQTTMGYRARHGPATLLMPEFAPVCLIESILRLSQRGYKITVKEIEVSEPKGC